MWRSEELLPAIECPMTSNVRFVTLAVSVLGILLLLTMVLLWPRGMTEAASAVITFPDANLEAAIREALDKPMGDSAPLESPFSYMDSDFIGKA